MKMKSMLQSMLRGWAAVAAVVALCGTLACRADWAQAESPEFALDTTVPEPGIVAAVCVPLWVWLRRR